MACLLKVLSDMLQSPQPLSHFHICPKPKDKISPTHLIYPAPPSSFDIATATNPSHFGFTDRDLGLTEMGLQTLGFLFVTFRSHRYEQIGPTESALQTPYFLFVTLRFQRSERIGPTKFA